MKLIMMLFFVLLSALITVAAFPSLRGRAQEALVRAELLPDQAAEPEPEQMPESESTSRLPAPGEVTLKSVWHGARERAARAVGKEAPKATAAGQPASGGGA